jgi:hypothetical protein
MLRSVRGKSGQEITLERIRVVDELVQKRRQLITSLSDNVSRDAGGRVLAFELDASFFDRVAAAETGGFFDSEDLPPWDTWISYCFDRSRSRWVLVSWVPASCISIVELATRVHMANAYQWVEAPLTDFALAE